MPDVEAGRFGGAGVFTHVKDMRLAQQVASQLIDAISKGKLRAGERLPAQDQLAQVFGVSRASIREATRILEATGLVTVQHGKGAFVHASYSAGEALPIWEAWLKAFSTEVIHLLEVRKGVESSSAEYAAQRATQEDLRVMEATVDHDRGGLLLTEDESLNLDTEFHAAVVNASHNPLLIRLGTTLVAALSADRRATMSLPGRKERSMQQHQEIFAAIKAGNTEDARRLAAQHIEDVRVAVIERLSHPHP
jgi:GntR family transcriptional repressor for pyruvate dehydrogenase complex